MYGVFASTCEQVHLARGSSVCIIVVLWKTMQKFIFMASKFLQTFLDPANCCSQLYCSYFTWTQTVRVRPGAELHADKLEAVSAQSHLVELEVRLMADRTEVTGAGRTVVIPWMFVPLNLFPFQGFTLPSIRERLVEQSKRAVCELSGSPQQL